MYREGLKFVIQEPLQHEWLVQGKGHYHGRQANHPPAQAGWNKNIVELICGQRVLFQVVSIKPQIKYMIENDPVLSYSHILIGRYYFTAL